MKVMRMGHDKVDKVKTHSYLDQGDGDSGLSALPVTDS